MWALPGDTDQEERGGDQDRVRNSAVVDYSRVQNCQKWCLIDAKGPESECAAG